MGEAIYVTLYFYAYDLININDDNFFQLCKNDPVTFCYTCSGFYPEKRKIINPTSHNSGIPTIPFLSGLLQFRKVTASTTTISTTRRSGDQMGDQITPGDQIDDQIPTPNKM